MGLRFLLAAPVALLVAVFEQSAAELKRTAVGESFLWSLHIKSYKYIFSYQISDTICKDCLQ